MRPLYSFMVLTAGGALLILSARAPTAAREPEGELAVRLRGLDARVYPTDGERAKELPRMLAENVKARMRAANLRENKAWAEVQSRADWEKYRDPRIQALRESLGRFPPAPKDLKVRVTRGLDGDGYRVQDLVFESRPGLVVTANLYIPADPPKSMPAILIAPSHHNPKTQGELQDMGMTWARQGCLVLVPDALGHGERRQHPFRSAKDYPHPFKVGRQDYYFRYNAGLQLQVVGESLMGWIAWDLMRCVDVLLAQPGVDKERVILLGSVAGGGDAAAVTAALDSRIAAVAPFNFGGPQPDFSAPADAEREIAELLEGGAAVCLVDVRGTGETRPADDSRGRGGASTDLSAEEWILGQTLVGSRLRDVRSVLRYLRGRGDLDAGRTVLWGDSFAAPNEADADLAVPLEADPFPHIGEPLGGLLALFGALCDDDVRAAYVRGGLAEYKSYLRSPFCYLPHDAIIPGALTQGDLCAAAAGVAPRPLRMEHMIDGLDRQVSAKVLEKAYETTRAAYRDRKAESLLQLNAERLAEQSAARWMLRQLLAN